LTKPAASDMPNSVVVAKSRCVASSCETVPSCGFSLPAIAASLARPSSTIWTRSAMKLSDPTPRRETTPHEVPNSVGVTSPLDHQALPDGVQITVGRYRADLACLNQRRVCHERKSDYRPTPKPRASVGLVRRLARSRSYLRPRSARSAHNWRVRRADRHCGHGSGCPTPRLPSGASRAAIGRRVAPLLRRLPESGWSRFDLLCVSGRPKLRR
jgi:hypothetical protein